MSGSEGIWFSELNVALPNAMILDFHCSTGERHAGQAMVLGNRALSELVTARARSFFG